MATRLIVVLLVLLAASSTASAQRLARVGVLHVNSPAVDANVLEAFRQGMRQLGHEEGRTFALEHRSAQGKLDELPRLAAELAASKVELILAGQTPSALAARKATGTIPIVFAQVNDPVGSKLVASLARPGGNVTGVTTINLALIPKRLELLREVSPKVSRVALLYNPGDASNVLAVTETERVSGALGVTLFPLGVRGPEEFAGAFAALAERRIDGLVVAAGFLTNAHARRIAELANASRLPAVYSAGEFVDAGGLIAYAADFSHGYYRAAAYVDRILRGAKPGDLPVEQASKFDLVVNLKTAKALGLAIPPNVLLRATRTIE